MCPCVRVCVGIKDKNSTISKFQNYLENEGRPIFKLFLLKNEMTTTLSELAKKTFKPYYIKTGPLNNAIPVFSLVYEQYHHALQIW